MEYNKVIGALSNLISEDDTLIIDIISPNNRHIERVYRSKKELKGMKVVKFSYSYNRFHIVVKKIALLG